MILENLDKLERANEVIDIKSDADRISGILKELRDELKSHDDLIALSAPQIGHNDRIFALKFNDEIRYFLNPLYVHRDELTISKEKWGKKNYLIPRFKKVEIIYMQSNGMPEQLVFTDYTAQLLQQMIDLLEGLQPSDYGLKLDKDFDDATKEEQEQIVNAYLESLGDIHASLKEEINNDPELHDRQRTLDFLTSVAKGETKLNKPKLNREQRRALAKQQKKAAKAFKSKAFKVK